MEANSRPPHTQATIPPTALVISRNESINSTVRLIFRGVISCRTADSAPDGKNMFKTSADLEVLVLDWSLQDKHNSIFKCLVAAKARKSVIVINVFDSRYQKSWVNGRLKGLRDNKDVYSVLHGLWSIPLSMALLKVRARIKSRA